VKGKTRGKQYQLSNSPTLRLSDSPVWKEEEEGKIQQDEEQVIYRSAKQANGLVLEASTHGTGNLHH
jgi:hypothetical protein